MAQYGDHNIDKLHLANVRQDFLLDPYTYMYLNATYQRNQDPPVSYEDQHTTDVITQKALGFIEDGINAQKPFFVGIAPVAPHSNVVALPIPDVNDPNAPILGPPPHTKHQSTDRKSTRLNSSHWW